MVIRLVENNLIKTYALLDANSKPYESDTKGTLGGIVILNRKGLSQ